MKTNEVVRGPEMNVDRSRIALLTGAVALAFTSWIPSRARAEPLPSVTVYKSPT